MAAVNFITSKPGTLYKFSVRIVAQKTFMKNFLRPKIFKMLCRSVEQCFMQEISKKYEGNDTTLERWKYFLLSFELNVLWRAMLYVNVNVKGTTSNSRFKKSCSCHRSRLVWEAYLCTLLSVKYKSTRYASKRISHKKRFLINPSKV